MSAGAPAVLVTGAAGLIGRHVVRALTDRGLRVRATSRSEADLLDESGRRALVADAGCSHLIHLAWITEHGKYWSSPDNEEWRDASLDLIRRFAETGGVRAVVTGSCAEYDWQRVGSEKISEDAPCRPHTIYGAAKHALHTDLAAFAATTGLSYAWGRIFLVYGEGEDERRLVPSVARALLHNEEAKCASGVPLRDFMDARDTGAAFAALLHSRVEGPVNIATGEGHTVAEVARRLGQLAGRPDLLRLGALPDPPNEPASLVANTSRLTGEVGFKPTVGLNEGLSQALEYWRERIAASDGPK